MLEIKGLNKSYGENEVLKDLNLKLDKPGIYALVGPNGIGKTTLMDIISDLTKYDSGEIKVNDIDNKNPEIFKYLSYARSLDMLYDNLTGLDHFIFAKNSRHVSDEKFEEVLNIFKVHNFMKRKVSTYSLGQKQKTLLTYFFMGDYDIYIMDEPVTGLDPTSVILLRNYLLKLKDDGKIVVLSSHTLSEVDKLTDDVMFLVDKKIAFENLSEISKEQYKVVTSNSENKKIVNIVGKNDLDDSLKKFISDGLIIDSIEKSDYTTEDRYIELYTK